jgi:hypothetical protein
MAKVLAAPAGTVVRSELTIPVGRRLHQMCGHFPTVPAPGGSRRPREELPAGPRRPAQPPASGCSSKELTDISDTKVET